MGFRIVGLDSAQFHHLFGQDAAYLADHGVKRMTVESKPGYPCRVSLRDADVGDKVLLMNFEHQPAASPYRSSHAIFIREGASSVNPAENEVPEMLRSRLLSVRAFDSDDMMTAADVVEGRDVEPIIDDLLSDESVAYLHLHNAKRGCFVARVERC